MKEQLYQKLADYVTSEAAKALVRDTRFLLLVGISGAGKDTIKERLLETGRYHRIISHTTRPPRMNHGVMESDGTDYHFISYEEVERMLDAQAFVEAKLFSQNVYGTSVAEIEQAHNDSKIAVADPEVQGAVEYKAISADVCAVFLLPPSYDVWQARLQRRYTGTDFDVADYKRRLLTAAGELRHALATDYFHFVINDDLEQTITIVDRLSREATPPERDEPAIGLARQLETAIEEHLATL